MSIIGCSTTHRADLHITHKPIGSPIAGFGAYLDGDNGDLGGPFNSVWAAGAGVDLSRSTSLPIFMEYRVFFSRDQFSGLTLGVHF